MALGVPEITQVVGATVRVPGRAVVPPLIAQAVTEAPFAATVEGVTVIRVPVVPVVPVEVAKLRVGTAGVVLTVAAADAADAHAAF